MLSLWPTDPGRSWTKLGLFDKPLSSLCCAGITGYRLYCNYFVETTDSLRKPNILLAKIKDLLLRVYQFCSFPNKATSALLLAVYNRWPSLSPSRSLYPCWILCHHFASKVIDVIVRVRLLILLKEIKSFVLTSWANHLSRFLSFAFIHKKYFPHWYAFNLFWMFETKVGSFVRKTTKKIGGRSGTPWWGSENL